jgi:hypothetical protein
LYTALENNAFKPRLEDVVVEETKGWLVKHLDSSEDDNDCETDDEDDAPPSKAERLTEFIEALPFCTPMVMGFLCLGVKANSDWFYCPCCSHMKIWYYIMPR